MNDLGRKLFYVHDPELLPKESFRDQCVFEEFTIVLGCYISHQRIFIFDVNDERLQGIEEVTAAHEMLHAAYDRLSLSEREEIDRQLLDFYATVSDKRLIETINTYQASDPTVVPSELHSIIGTEVREIPESLERYYTRYFDDRLAVVSLAESYALEFSSRQDLIESYDKQLEEQKGLITALEADLTRQSRIIDEERQRIENLRNDVERFNAEIDGFNGRIVNYNRTLETLRSQIETYNELVVTRNAVAIEERELIEAIDTSEKQLQE
jgi:hypothetical protein